MIGKVSGTLDYRAGDHVLIDTGGVGYLVHCSERTLAAMPGPGGAVALYTDLLVREDLMQLYGFATLAEREWHRLLMSVQGVGAKAALAILGALGVDGLSRALAIGDAAAFRSAPGVGPKIAQRVVLELKSKAPGVIAMGAQGARAATGSVPAAREAGVIEAATAAGEGGAEASAEALSALINLGYGPGEAAAAISEAGLEPGLGTAALIRAALRRLAPKA